MTQDMSQVGPAGWGAGAVPPAAGDTPLARIAAERIALAGALRDPQVEYAYEDGLIAGLGWVEESCGAELAADAAIAQAARAYVVAVKARDSARAVEVIRGEKNLAGIYQAMYDAHEALFAAVDANPEVQP